MTWIPEPKNDIKTNIGEAVGAASTCWIGGTGDAVFDEAQASLIADDLESYVLGLIETDMGSPVKAAIEALQKLTSSSDAGAAIKAASLILDYNLALADREAISRRDQSSQSASR